MESEFSSDLLFTALVTGALALWIAWRQLPLGLALPIVVFRFALPVMYFAWWADGTWSILDDKVYTESGGEILNHGYNPWSILATDDGMELLSALAGGRHILYVWWNTLAQYIFGPHYFAAVFLNIVVTFLTAGCLRATVELLGFRRGYCLGLHVLLLLHWDLVSWSSIMNMKDLLVQFLTAGALYCATRFFQRCDLHSVVGFVATIVGFSTIRFYIPLLVVLAVSIWLLSQWQSMARVFFLPLIAVAAYLFAPMALEGAQDMDPLNVLTGTARILTTPLPWSIAPEYTFLLIPTILNGFLLLPAFVGFVSLWMRNVPARLFLIYYVIMILLLAITDELQGPRQRLQLAFILSWCQLEFFVWMLSFRKANKSTDSRPPTIRPRTKQPALAERQSKSFAGQAQFPTPRPVPTNC